MVGKVSLTSTKSLLTGFLVSFHVETRGNHLSDKTRRRVTAQDCNPRGCSPRLKKSLIVGTALFVVATHLSSVQPCKVIAGQER